MAFPATRMRRLRRTDVLRSLVRETRLAPADLIAPLFVHDGATEEIGSMPGQYHLSIESLVEEAAELRARGVPAVILFGIPSRKDEAASQAYTEDGIVQEALRALR